ncbi:MAG TPA: M20/M25/M40 family metallo-hydrolase [Candidatus Limnocylindrales bacterium]|nr:M20/M25/M40 family metallo-hydrolase [Candidatus Limnocylindrales bacterium]
MSVQLPSAGLSAVARERAGDELIEAVRDLIRIPSINPPPDHSPDGELRAATRIAQSLGDAGVPSEVHESVPGRGSVTARVRGDGTGGEPLLLLSHLDVVPAPVEGWTHDPFGADIADGYIYGRGAVDMKHLVAMELTVMRMLAAEARAAGRDPASDPIPGLTRDVLFASTADEEAGGLNGILPIVLDRPELLRAAGAVNESGAVTTTIGDGRFYPIGIAEKGYAVYRITVHGTSGHGSMPRDDNAAVLAAAVVQRLAAPGPPRITPPMEGFLAEVRGSLNADQRRLAEALVGPDPRPAEVALQATCDPFSARLLRALLRDTVSPNMVHAGVKYNIIPGEATVDVDCRILPGTTEEGMRATLVERIGPELARVCDVELVIYAPAVDAPASGDLYETMVDTVRAHDPGSIPVPIIVPYATDAKHIAALETPAYGFSPLRLQPGEPFLELWHGVDERVRVDALRWGLPVLYDVVRRFCG